MHAVKMTRGRPFPENTSGNTRGRPRGSRNRSTLVLEALLDGEAETLTRKGIERALAGDATMLRLCLDRLLPPRRERPLNISLPQLKSAEDSVAAMSAIFESVACGEIMLSEATQLGNLIEQFTKSLECREFERRLQLLELERTRLTVLAANYKQSLSEGKLKWEKGNAS